MEALKEGATKKDDNLVPFARATNPLKPQASLPSEEGSPSKRFEDFCLEAEARIWP